MSECTERSEGRERMPDQHSTTSIPPGAVRELLRDPKLFPALPADLGDDTELALDSLGLVWLLHQVQEQYGLTVELSDAEVQELTSVRRIAACLNAVALDPAAGEPG